MKTISVIIPVYQVSEYVERCIRSVMGQSFSNIECIIVDDATQDDSIIKCENLIKNYQGSIKFKIIHHEKNRGLSAARNTGTDAATGDYLFYIDSDDEITPDCLEKLLSFVMKDDSIEMVQGNCKILHDGREGLVYRTCPMRLRSNDEVRTEYLSNRNIYISVWNRLLKRSFVVDNGLYCKEGIVHEDYLWLFYLTKYLKHALLLDEVTYLHPIRSGSITTGTDQKVHGDSFRIIFEDILHHLTEGRERGDLKGYLYLFCKRYMTYVGDVPAFHDTCRLYMKQARKYGLWYVFSVLGMVYLICHVGSPLKLFDFLNAVRWKIKKGCLLSVKSYEKVKLKF